MDTEVIPQQPGSLWRNRDYLLLWLGEAVSSLGTSCTQFAFPLLMVGLTRSIAAAGLAYSLGQLPYVLLSLPAGALVDRWPRKRVMLLCTFCLMVCVASIPLALLPDQRTTAAASPLRHRLWPGSHFAFLRAGQIGSTGMGRAKEPAHHSSRTERVDRWLLLTARTRAGQPAL